VNLEDKSILMESIKGNLVKDIMDNLNSEDRQKLAENIGYNIGLMHNNDIIHGDITSSNMLVDEDKNFVFIDFGLGGYSDLFEDKATDLLVLKKSFQSIDYDIANETFDWVVDGYISSYSGDLNKNQIKNKINEIESRGRYTH
jgi:N6-L-threonylcarbamoyladenine synthase/protein kinase Bud32